MEKKIMKAQSPINLMLKDEIEARKKKHKWLKKHYYSK
jgi:hypothetical protein